MSETTGDSAMNVSIADVRRVAELANLELSSEEETRMLRDLDAILGHVAELNQLDTSSVEAMAQVSDVLATPPQSTTRADKVVSSLPRQAVMAASPDHDQVFFKVPKVIER